MLLYMRSLVPVVFDDIEYDKEFYDKYLSEGRWTSYIEDPHHDVINISMHDKPEMGGSV